MAHDVQTWLHIESQARQGFCAQHMVVDSQHDRQQHVQSGVVLVLVMNLVL